MTLPATSLFGRDRELDELAGALARAHAMALTGPAGVGKSRLARELGHRWSGDVVLCDVSTGTSEAACLRSVGRGLGIHLPSSELEATAQIARALEGRRNALLVLDGAEAMPASLDDAVVRWTDAAKLLVTSRRKPGYVDEEVALGPLRPDDAMRLFIERARQVRPGFELASHHETAARELLARVDCLPLAIELLAPRLRLLTPPQLLARLDQDAHTSGPLYAAVERSWSLLRPEEQQALAQISVFPGGFFVPAAEAVLALGDGDVLTVLESLVAHSLLRAYHVPELPDEVRIAPFGVVRELARSKLADGGAAAARHAAYYLEASERWDAAIESADEVDATARLIVELPNIERAYAIATDPGMRARLGLVLHLAYQRAGPFEEQRKLTSDIRAAAWRAGDDALIARTALAAGRVFRWDDQILDSDRVLAEALRHAEMAGDVATEACVHRNLAANAFRIRDLERAAVHVSNAQQAAEQSPLPTDRVNALHALGYLHGERAEPLSAEGCLERAVALAEEVGAPGLIVLVRESLAEVVLRQGRFDEAVRHATDVIRGYRALGYKRQLVHAFVLRARAQTFLDRAAASADAAEAVTMARRYGLSAAQEESVRFSVQLAFLRRDFHAVIEQSLQLPGELKPWVWAARRMLGHPLVGLELGEPTGFAERALARFCRNEPLDGDVAPDAESAAWLEAIQEATDHRAAPSTLEITADLRWFRVTPGDGVDITRRRAMRGILKALVDRHHAAAGTRLTLDDLLQAGWPGERMSFDSGQRRVWVTINRLRNLGLEPLLITADDGYMLAPATRIVRN